MNIITIKLDSKLIYKKFPKGEPITSPQLTPTVKVTVRYYGIVNEATGVRSEEIQLQYGSTVKDLLDKLIQKYHAPLERYLQNNRGLIDYLTISVNEVDIFSLEKYETVLQNDDRIFLMPPIGGG